MKDSTRRALRSALHTVIALAASAPALLADLPDSVKGASIIGAVTFVSKLVNVLEDRGILPALGKSDPADTASAS